MAASSSLVAASSSLVAASSSFRLCLTVSGSLNVLHQHHSANLWPNLLQPQWNIKALIFFIDYILMEADEDETNNGARFWGADVSEGMPTFEDSLPGALHGSQIS